MRRTLALSLATALCTFGVAEAGAAPSAKVVDPTIQQPGWSAAKNAWGQPDLSGSWSNATITPLTRNTRLTNKATLPPTEVKALESTFAAALEQRDETTNPNVLPGSDEDKAKDAKLFAVRPDFAAAGGDVGGYNNYWLDPGNHILEVDGEFRTSIFTTPDGQLPKRKSGSNGGASGPYNGGGLGSFDSYETRPLGERCVIGFGRNAGPPMFPNGYYNNNYQIVQTGDAVAITVEMIHDTRVIRLNSQHRTDGLRPWMGDSIGHYEGNTFVVETTNIPESQNLYGAWKTLKVTERFTRVSPTRIKYSFEAEDPSVWDKPWGGEYTFSPVSGLYEYACHEGNYALPAILAGARRQEEETASVTAAAKGTVPVAASSPKAKRGAD